MATLFEFASQSVLSVYYTLMLPIGSHTRMISAISCVRTCNPFAAHRQKFRVCLKQSL